VLTLIFPIYKVRLPLTGAIALIVTAATIRTLAELFIIGDVYSPTIRDLILLSGLRIVEYLPLGIFAFVLSRTIGEGQMRSRRFGTAAVGVFLILASGALTPERLGGLSDPMAVRMVWLIFQAVCGASIMCLAVHVTLSAYRGVLPRSMNAGLGQLLQERALAIFLVHPFFIDLFETIVGAPDAFSLPMLAPKLLFAVVCSILLSSVLVQTRGLRKIV
jgi:hypothetical protein